LKFILGAIIINFRHLSTQAYRGSPGMNYLLEEFRDELRQRGLEQYFDRIFLTAPSKLFAFR
jgi:hypothetical protein